VAGTEKINRQVIDNKKIIRQEENAILVGLIYKEQTEPMVNEYLDELAFLAETAGANTIKRFTQKLPHPDSKIFVGKGKLEEIRQFILLKGNITLVIFDDLQVLRFRILKKNYR